MTTWEERMAERAAARREPEVPTEYPPPGTHLLMPGVLVDDAGRVVATASFALEESMSGSIDQNEVDMAETTDETRGHILRVSTSRLGAATVEIYETPVPGSTEPPRLVGAVTVRPGQERWVGAPGLAVAVGEKP